MPLNVQLRQHRIWQNKGKLMKKVLLPILLASISLFAQDLDYKYEFNGRFEYDVGQFEMTNETYNESSLRRAKLTHKGSFYDKSLFYETEIDLAKYGNDSTSDEIDYKDNYIGYKTKSNESGFSYRIKAGNIKVPFSLDFYAGSKYSSFMESPLTDTLTQGRKLGVETLFSKESNKQRVNLFLGAFQNSINEEKDNEAQKNRYATRITYDYKFSKKHLLHFGGSYLYSDIDGDNVKYNQEAESNLVREKYVSTKVKNVNTTQNRSLEALYVNNSFNFQGEYMQTNVDSLSAEYTFNAYYAQVGYFLFGSSKQYKTSTSKFSSKNISNNEVELAFRYSFIDLNDKDELGGTQKDYNFALNWHLNKNLKLMSNYIIAYPSSDKYNGSFNVFQARAVLSF